MSSIHEVIVVPVKLRKHENADSLSVVDIFDGGYQCVVQTQFWLDKNKAYFIPPDNLVPVNRPEFVFLASEAKADGTYRVKAKKLRGIVSYGMMIAAPEDSVVGTDVTELLGVKPYDPETANPEKGNSAPVGQNCAGPVGLIIPKYDVENLRKYHHSGRVFTDGEPVVIREKVDGQNIKFCYHKGELFCGSRENWKREYPIVDHLTLEYFIEKGRSPEDAAKLMEKVKGRSSKMDWTWSTYLSAMNDSQEGIERFLKDNPSCVLFGESYGNVGSMKYGCKDGVLKFAAFDVLDHGVWWDATFFNEKMLKYKIPTAPLLNELRRGEGVCKDFDFIEPIPYSFEMIDKLCDGMSLLYPTQIKEGVVVTSIQERYVDHFGRAQLKIVSPTYSEKKK